MKQSFRISFAGKYLIIFVAAIAMAAIICIKNKKEDRHSTEPLIEKKWAVTTPIGLTYIFN